MNKTIKDDIEPLWMTILRMTNNSMNSNLMAMKTTKDSFQKNITNLHSFLTQGKNKPIYTEPLSIS
jgi:hypothetical protein